MGFNRCGISGGDNQFAALGFGVPGLTHVSDHGPMREIHTIRHGDDADGTALRDQTDRCHATEFCNHITPSASGVHDHDGGNISIATPDIPLA